MVAWLASRTEGTEWKPSPSSDTLAKTAWAAHSSQGHASFLTVPLSCIWLQLYDQRVGKQLWSSCSKTSHIECITSALGTYTFKTQAKYKQTQLYFTENRMMLSRDPQPTSVHTSATLHVGPMAYGSHPASFPQKVCKKKEWQNMIIDLPIKERSNTMQYGLTGKPEGALRFRHRINILSNARLSEKLPLIEQWCK